MSPRRAEAMRWACMGKTGPEIAIIMEISTGAAYDLLTRAQRDLGALNITHAAVLFDRQQRGPKP